MIAETVEVKVRLRCYVRKDKKHWVSVCPRLDVYSQGETKQEAQESLREALELWFESCLERGALDKALSELGFRPPAGVLEGAAGTRRRAKSKKPAADVRGDEFPVELTIPAYQAAALLGDCPPGVQ